MDILLILKSYFFKQKLGDLLMTLVFSLFTILLLVNLIQQFSYSHSYESWQLSEWLINYQGGYVRRGLFGEILFLIAKKSPHIEIGLIIKIFSLTCLIALVAFFIIQFKRKGIPLYILSTCLFFAVHFTNGMYWTKRDYLMMLLYISCIAIYEKVKNIYLNILLVNVILILAIQVHEAIALFSLPILFLIVRIKFYKYSFISSIFLAILFLLPSIFSFLLVIKYHGDFHTAQNIWDSWVLVIGATPSEVDNWSHGVISSMSWTSEMALQFHKDKNFHSESMGISSLPFWILTAPIIYYIASNYMYVFQKDKKTFTNENRTNFSGILFFQFICILPFFLFLSCDIGRVVFYWMTSSFIIYFMIPKKAIIQIFPRFYLNIIQNLNDIADRIIYPSKAIIAILLLIIGIPTAGFSIDFIIESSVIGNILMWLSKI
ncbi:MAG: hypothetical protein M9958_08605 [Chitinophagales bacterium]|nr:hypothetical protein [Chitinophagales bacterium]